MNNYSNISNEYFEILISCHLKEYGEEILKYATGKIKEYLNFFKEETYGEKIKGSYFTNRVDFIKRIKEISPRDVALPPEWATGCFYGGEVQVLLNEEKLYDKFYTLAHETFHLLFTKFVYEKNNYNRIVWLDESLAGNFDGTVENLIKENKFPYIVKRLMDTDNLPTMNQLSFDRGNIITGEYDGYDLFKVVGRYLIETKTEEELLLYIQNEDLVLKEGDSILEISLKYFEEKYNL